VWEVRGSKRRTIVAGGAHFNPAVMLADASQGGLAWREVLVYVCRTVGRARLLGLPQLTLRLVSRSFSPSAMSRRHRPLKHPPFGKRWRGVMPSRSGNAESPLYGAVQLLVHQPELQALVVETTQARAGLNLVREPR
jgi:hypothetical protein